MTDIVTYCDINTCGECPRYGDDCDGDKRVEHTDYISRADALEQMAQAECGLHYDDCEADNCSCSYIQRILDIPSAEYITEKPNDVVKPSNDVINRADAVKTVIRMCSPICDWQDITQQYPNCVVAEINALPSADAVPQLRQTDTLIIADALRYLAKDTERHELDRARAEELREQILRYGASMCSSADTVHGEWIWRTDIPIGDGRTSAGYICSHCGKDYWHGNKLKFCPNCGAKMKGGDEE